MKTLHKITCGVYIKDKYMALKPLDLNKTKIENNSDFIQFPDKLMNFLDYDEAM